MENPASLDFCEDAPWIEPVADVPMINWTKFKRSKKDRSGIWLVKMIDGTIWLGEFYCGEFVRDGFCYNHTPGVIPHITSIKRVA